MPFNLRLSQLTNSQAAGLQVVSPALLLHGCHWLVRRLQVGKHRIVQNAAIPRGQHPGAAAAFHVVPQRPEPSKLVNQRDFHENYHKNWAYIKIKKKLYIYVCIYIYMIIYGNQQDHPCDFC